MNRLTLIIHGFDRQVKGRKTEAYYNVIDKKGRLFGKINIVDLLVLLLILAAAVVLGVKFLRGGGDIGEPPRTLIYTARAMEVSPETYENVCQYVNKQAGLKDQLMSADKLLDGYIVDVSATPHVPTASDTVGGDTLDLLFTIEATVTDSVTNAVGTQQVRVGKPHVIKGQHIEFEKGQVMTCQWSD